jgi:ADP-ribose pyrophosphatase YjhB (NUDIX family)
VPAGGGGTGGTGHDHAQHARGARGPRFCPECGGPLAGRQVEQRVRPACPACGFVWYDDPKVAACTIPAVEGRLILVRRSINPARGLWVFPGGYMDRGETVEEAAVRETREETGLDVAVRGLSGVYSYRDSIVVIVVYRVEVRGGRPVPGAECMEVRGFAPDEVPWDHLAFPSTRDALRDWLAARPPDAGGPRGAGGEARG